MDNGRTLGICGEQVIKYVDVVFRGEAMTLVVWVIERVRAEIKAPMVIFTNSNKSYPVRGVADNIPRVTYCNEPKDWMDTTLFAKYFAGARCYQRDPYGHIGHVWCDNSSNHNTTPALQNILAQKNTHLCYLLACSTSLIQPANQFVISKIKDAWNCQWEAKKIQLIVDGEWQNDRNGGGRGWSGKLKKPWEIVLFGCCNTCCF